MLRLVWASPAGAGKPWGCRLLFRRRWGQVLGGGTYLWPGVPRAAVPHHCLLMAQLCMVPGRDAAADLGQQVVGRRGAILPKRVSQPRLGKQPLLMKAG